ncbi:hypothetical protein A3K64_00790 [Candidatus Micrarchaeota archaeon RBG_16_36_9]|nr:MAG: hypothetical protein A3K64_00790 [Candidatus Micrarchaeota archaeon RBG_16_36_9]
MAPEAYVLINAVPGREDDFVKNVREIEGVTSAFRVNGVYDIVAKIKAPTEEGVKNIVTDKIRRLPYLGSTLTMFTVEK